MRGTAPRVALFALLATVLAGPAVVPASAQPAEPFHLERVVPEHTFALLTVPDAGAFWKGFQRSSLMRIYQDEEMQEFMAPVLAEIEKGLLKLKDGENVDLLEIASCLRGEIGVALLGMDLSKGAPYPDLLIVVDAKDKRETFRKILDGLVAKAKSENEKFGTRVREIRGVEVHVFEDPQTRMDGAFLGSAFVLATMPATLDAAIQAWQTGDARTLDKLPLYRTAMSRVEGTGVAAIRLFLNVEKMLEAFGEYLAPYEAIVNETGLGGIQAVSLSSTLHGAGFSDRIHIHAPGEKRGLFRLFSGRPVDREQLKVVPQNALHVSAGTMDLDRIWDEVFRILATVQPDAFAAAQMQLEQVEGFLGFKIKQDLLASIGHDYLLYAAPPRGGGFIPEVVLSLSMRDKAKFQTCLDQALGILADQAGPDELQRESTEFKGETIHYIKLPGNVPVTPSYAFVDGRLLVALMPQTLKGVLRARSAERPTPSILEREEFAHALGQLPKNVSAIGYTDLPSVFNLAYNTALPFIQQVEDLGDLPLDMALLPSAEAVSRYLEPALSGVWSDDEGISWVSASPVSGPALIVPMFLAVLMTARAGEVPVMVEGLPEPGGRVEVQPRDADLQNLDEIGAGLLIFYVENGRYPADVDELVKKRALPDTSVLVSPGDLNPRTVGSVKCSYEYVGPGATTLRKGKDRAVVVWSKGPVRAVLFLDGSSRRVPDGEFQKLLAETRERIAKGDK